MSAEVIKIKEDIGNSLVSDAGGEPPMDSYFGQYLDARFAGIEADVKEIRSDIKEIRSDIKDQSRRIDGLKYWILGSFLVLATLFFTVVGYFTWTMQNQFNHHQASIQSQMQAFSDYVKSVTKPQESQAPQTPPKGK
jgi:cell division protein FtsL